MLLDDAVLKDVTDSVDVFTVLEFLAMCGDMRIVAIDDRAVFKQRNSISVNEIGCAFDDALFVIRPLVATSVVRVLKTHDSTLNERCSIAIDSQRSSLAAIDTGTTVDSVLERQIASRTVIGQNSRTGVVGHFPCIVVES